MTFELTTTGRQLTQRRNSIAGLSAQLRSLLEGERDFIANAANFSSLLFYSLPDLNWVGSVYFEGRGTGAGAISGTTGMRAHPSVREFAARRRTGGRRLSLITFTSFPATSPATALQIPR